jgi:hypothetical protein
MSDRVVRMQGDVALLAYQVSAEREGTPIHEALCSSVYVRDEDSWLRMSHQQTPLS